MAGKQHPGHHAPGEHEKHSSRKRAVHHVVHHHRAHKHVMKHAKHKKSDAPTERKIDSYDIKYGKLPVTITIVQKHGEFVPSYIVNISTISQHTEIILEKIRHELIEQVNIGMLDITKTRHDNELEKRMQEAIAMLVRKHFPEVDEEGIEFLTSYLIQRSLGLGRIELLMEDAMLEEIAVNNAQEPVWVYHRKHGWLKTNIFLANEDQVRHYASMIGRKVGRQINVLEPLMDAHLGTGDRINATLSPVSVKGNTITMRKFAAKPWTITDFLNSNTLTTRAAAMIWLGVQYEMSMIIAGGTASGKTSMLNTVSNFFPPNQRIISIEDTREIQLPSFLHWLPMNTRLPNPEGKGAITMLDLLVNSLRQRPDRIIVGEIRRKAEAEVLFEAIHTGHSVYATVHANNAKEVLTRLTSPPIEIPKSMIPAVSMVIVQFRNRRTGNRRTFQVAEVLDTGDMNVLMQYDPKKDHLLEVGHSHALMENLEMYTGYSRKEIEASIQEKIHVLEYLQKKGINTVDGVGTVIAEYYTNKEYLMKMIRENKTIEPKSG